MTKPEYFNDAPILTPADDRFGIDRFAQGLAQSKGYRPMNNTQRITVGLIVFLIAITVALHDPFWFTSSIEKAEI
jgi:hypothetical protein